MTEVLKGDKHFTASVWLISNSTPKKVLLIHHKKLNVWLQPGGHMERDENPIEAAIRETLEETGIDVGFLINSVKKVDLHSTRLPVPDFFLEETIPENASQPQHFHLDLMYVAYVNEDLPKKNAKETFDIGWFEKDQALKLPLFKDTVEILCQLLK